MIKAYNLVYRGRDLSSASCMCADEAARVSCRDVPEGVPENADRANPDVEKVFMGLDLESAEERCFSTPQRWDYESIKHRERLDSAAFWIVQRIAIGPSKDCMVMDPSLCSQQSDSKLTLAPALRHRNF